jgi:hypothetical protein
VQVDPLVDVRGRQELRVDGLPVVLAAIVELAELDLRHPGKDLPEEEHLAPARVADDQVWAEALGRELDRAFRGGPPAEEIGLRPRGEREDALGRATVEAPAPDWAPG